MLPACNGKIRRVRRKCSEVSIPSIELTPAIRIATLMHATDAMIDSCGEGYWHGGEYNPAWNEFLGRAKIHDGRLFSSPAEEYSSSGQILADGVLQRVPFEGDELEERARRVKWRRLSKNFDVLACPTNIVKPPLLKDKIEFAEINRRGFMLSSNTQPFNMTGNPAITIPCGMRGGLPVAFQLIAKHWKESTLFKVSRAFEKNFDWKKL